MFKLKRIASAILSVLLVTGLMSGCSSQKAESKDSENKVVTITFSPQKDTTPATKAIIEAFEKKYPNIKINLQELPSGSDSTHNTYVTALSAGDSSIDVMTLDVVWTAEFASAGWVLPLDDKLTAEEKEKFLPGPIEAVTYNGKIYAVPNRTDAGVLYYRKDIISTPPKTWEELIQMSKDNIGKNGIKYGFVFQGKQYEGFVCDALEFINGNGGLILNGNTVTVNSPQVIQGLQYMKDMISQNIVPPGITTYQENESREIFKQGSTLFMRNWPNAWAQLNADDSPVKGKIGVTSIPIGKDGKESASTLGGWNVGINQYSEHPEEAWKFVEFLTSEEGQKISALQGSRLPTRKDLYQDSEVLAKNPFWSDLYNAFLTAKPRPISPVYPKISDSMQINFNKAVNGLMPIEDAVKNVEKDLNDIVK